LPSLDADNQLFCMPSERSKGYIGFASIQYSNKAFIPWLLAADLHLWPDGGGGFFFLDSNAARICWPRVTGTLGSGTTKQRI